MLRSVEDSLTRLGLDRIDILYIHDSDGDLFQAYPALHELREQGVIGAIGAGMNQIEMTQRFAEEGDFDVFMLAGRYTLLEQPALARLLPLCVEKDISIVIAGVMNSGILADPTPGARYNYAEAPAELIEKAQRIAAVCLAGLGDGGEHRSVEGVHLVGTVQPDVGDALGDVDLDAIAHVSLLRGGGHLGWYSALPVCLTPRCFPSQRRVDRAAWEPHMPCTPPPGGVDAEHRNTPSTGVA